LSYYYSLPNRVFDYIQAGVPILATRFPEIANVVDKYKTGMLIDHYEPEFLAEIMNQLLENPYPTVHFETVARELCWENEEKVLVKMLSSLS
jgi:glycosyltransferase involved in cell wall biosynthesis